MSFQWMPLACAFHIYTKYTHMYDTYEPARMSYARAQTNASGEHEKKIHAHEPFSINSIYILDLSTCAAHACMHMSDLFNMTNKTAAAKKSSQVYIQNYVLHNFIFSLLYVLHATALFSQFLYVYNICMYILQNMLQTSII